MRTPPGRQEFWETVAKDLAISRAHSEWRIDNFDYPHPEGGEIVKALFQSAAIFLALCSTTIAQSTPAEQPSTGTMENFGILQGIVHNMELMQGRIEKIAETQRHIIEHLADEDKKRDSLLQALVRRKQISKADYQKLKPAKIPPLPLPDKPPESK